MLRSSFCELFDSEVPVLQAAIWPATSPELVAAVADAGAIGSIGTVFGSAESVRAQIDRVRELTDGPFVVNHVVPQLDEDAFEATLHAQPAAISLALGDPGELVDRAHAAGVKVIQQIHTVAQAVGAAEQGADVIIAQGSEAGGQGLAAGVGAMALTPQVVDAVAPVPVLVAGGVADGRGLAAALVLGAAGANVGTRFLASEEAGAPDAWKQRIVEIDSEDAVRFETWGAIMPPNPRSWNVVPRVIRTEFVAQWEGRADEAGAEAERLRGEIMRSVQSGTAHETTPFTGQTAGLVRDVPPAGEIVRRMAAQAEEALARVTEQRVG